jgi:hypothetical protein
MKGSLVATHKRTSVTVLSCEERKRFATFIELLIVIDKRVNKHAKEKKAKRGSGHSCCLLKTKCKDARSKIGPLLRPYGATKGKRPGGLFTAYA